MVEIKVPAKVNFSLLVGEKRGDRHLLDMVVAGCEDIYDVVRLSARRDRRVTCNLPIKGNTAVLMAERYVDCFLTNGAHIEIEKGIPVSAGLGGSSADAAAVAVGMQKLFGKQPEKLMIPLCDSVGSDVFYMTIGGFARLTGFGEIVRPFSAPALFAVIIKPQGGVSTAAAFRAYDEKPTVLPADNERLMRALGEADFSAMRENMANELYPYSNALNPGISAALCEAEKSGAVCRVMSGSGSGVLAIYQGMEQAQNAAALLRDRFEFVKYTKIL